MRILPRKTPVAETKGKKSGDEQVTSRRIEVTVERETVTVVQLRRRTKIEPVPAEPADTN